MNRIQAPLSRISDEGTTSDGHKTTSDEGHKTTSDEGTSISDKGTPDRTSKPARESYGYSKFSVTPSSPKNVPESK